MFGKKWGLSWKEKKWLFDVAYGQDKWKCTCMSVCMIFWQMLRMALNVCKMNLSIIRCARLWPEIDRTDIDLNLDEYEWQLIFCYENMIMIWFSENFTKWRLDDVTIICWTWKCFCHVLWWWPMTVSKLKEIGWMDFEKSSAQLSVEK